MKNLSNVLIIMSYAICLVFSFLAVLFGLKHSPGKELISVIAGISGLIFIGLSLYEILSSGRIKASEKVIWTICIVIICQIAGLFYLLGGRERIITVLDTQL
jgi:hypothetical protein